MRGKTNHLKWLMCMLFVLMAGSAVFAQVPTPDSLKIIYVDDDAGGLNVGTSWEHAVNSLQDALLLAYFSEKPVEIRVAQGTYTPDRGLGIMPGDSGVSFQLINGVTIKGGYAVNMSGHRGQDDIRDINQYKSILSGDLNADDGPGLDTVKENSYHIITSSENDDSAVLDGFTITGSGISSAGTNPYNHSSGMYNDMSSPTLIDCTFTENKATERGAGMYNNNGEPVIRNCTFSENEAPDGGAGMYNDNSSPKLISCTFNGNDVGGYGAGIYNNNSEPVLLNCTFAANTAGMSGGGMYNEKSAPTLTNCTFTANSAGDGGGAGMYSIDSISMLADCAFSRNMTEGSGGGIYNDSSKSTLLGCIFTQNSAYRSGGGLYNHDNSETSLTHCIFSGNVARSGGGMENLNNSYSTLLNCTFSANLAETIGGGGISNIQEGHSTLVNCILWADRPDEIRLASTRGGAGGIVNLSYSNVQNSWPGEGNLNMDPLFSDAENGDFHLKSQTGRWDSISQSWIFDEVSSPCIDTGDPNIPVGLERFPNGDRINMGAYGGTPEGSLSPSEGSSLLTGKAWNPYPTDGTVFVQEYVPLLTWNAGFNTVYHDVYFSHYVYVGHGTDTEKDAVADADTSDRTGIYRGRQAATSYTPPEGFGGRNTIYYWRVDEIDSEGNITKGDVWTFSVTPPSPPKGRTCFTAETGVWVNGTFVPISKAAAGQIACGISNLGTIQEVQEHNGTFTCYDILLESGNSISVAENHYFLTESRQWISLKSLKAGTKLKTSKGSIGIKSITKRPTPYAGNVYNLNIAGSDRYLVGKEAVIVRDF
jgi:hypothetical protein